ncbi:MAG: H-NS family nucleoid-associated regulatory protein [Lautropia sp.]
MTTTFLQVSKEIEKLKAQAEKVRAKETKSVIAGIREAIAAYGLTAADLGFESTRSRPSADRRGPAIAPPGRKQGRKAASKGNAIYTDGMSSWTGHGRRPRWIVEGLAAGKTLDDFRAP